MQILNKNNKFYLNNNIIYINSLFLFFQNNQENLYISNNLFYNLEIKLYYELQLTNQILKVSELNSILYMIK